MSAVCYTMQVERPKFCFWEVISFSLSFCLITLVIMFIRSKMVSLEIGERFLFRMYLLAYKQVNRFGNIGEIAYVDVLK